MLDPLLIKTLISTGFEEKEARVYLAALTLGKGSVTEIAKLAELKRAIVYHVLGRLEAKGFAHEVLGAKVQQFAAIEPTKVFHTIKGAVDDFKFMIPMMRALQDKGGHKPRVEYFEGKEAILSVYRSFECAKEMRYISSIERFNTLIPDEVDAWIERYKTGKINADIARSLLSNTKEDREWGDAMKAIGQEIKYLPKSQMVEMDFSICDDVLAITSFDPFFVVVIHSAPIAKSAAQLFDLVWIREK